VRTIDLDKEFSVGPSPRLQDLEALRMRGFAAVVDLRIPGELGALSVEHEKEAVESLGMTSFHLAVPARTLPSTLLDQFRREVGLLPKPVYVHCTKGRRAALFTIIHLGIEVDDAEEQILNRLRSLEFIEDLEVYEEPIRIYVRRAEEPYDHLKEVIW